jgi:hypothetical protein
MMEMAMKRILVVIIAALALFAGQALSPAKALAWCNGSANVWTNVGIIYFSSAIYCNGDDSGPWLAYSRRWNPNTASWDAFVVTSGNGRLDGVTVGHQWFCWAVGGRGIFEQYEEWYNGRTGNYGSASSGGKVLC